MDFILSYNNNEGTLVFPVVPSGGIALTTTQDNAFFDGINGELQALGALKLSAFALSSIFPNRNYSWIRPKSSYDGWAYVHTINAVRKRRIPFRAILLDNSGREIFNLPVSVESFEYGLDRAGDIAYTMQCKEYRFTTAAHAASLSVPGSAAGAATQAAVGIVQTASQAAASDGGTYTKKYTATDAAMMARVMFCEARGVQSKTEIACIGWTVLNRVDAGVAATIVSVITAKNQFAYSAAASTTSDYGYSLVELATDVLNRWSREKAGQASVGRVLPKKYLWYSGDGKHNYFRNKYSGGTRWNYSLPSPYAN